MEVAAFLADKAASVSVVDLVQVPFQLTLGKELGTHMKQVLQCLNGTVAGGNSTGCTLKPVAF